MKIKLGPPKEIMTEYHILNLGAGVQSTALYLMMMRGEAPKIDYAIFADTKEEPQAVYRHMDWLKSLNGPAILIRSIGKLGDDLLAEKNSAGLNLTRFASIPTFCTDDEGATVGRNRRQCSSEYKIDVIERTIRREVVGLKPRQRMPKDIHVFQYYGISFDERSRASRIWERYHIEGSSLGEPKFPLVDLQWTRANCIEWLQDKVPHKTPRSACVFCPFHNDAEWQQLKDAGGPDWERAVQIDEALRGQARAAQYMDKRMYLHRSCKPLVQIDFHPKSNPKEQQMGFGLECEGVCGL